MVLLTAALVLKENRVKRPGEPLREGCLFCHAKFKDPDPSHPISAFGCATCHLGNSYSLDKERAHFTVVRNPGDLRIVGTTCGKTGCHAEIVTRVKNSVMATNRGILKTLQLKWPPLLADDRQAGLGVRDLMVTEHHQDSLAIGLYRKMCAGCHLWKKRGDREGEIGRRGGGCSDCHVLDEEKGQATGKEVSVHPAITTRIPSRNCVKCHNRSARIGLSYFGRFESARYGTPYVGKGLDRRRLSGRRFFLQLASDVHFKKAGMECIDCHTATGLMGDGRQYDEMEDQVDITCKACHGPGFSNQMASGSLANKLLFLNKRVPKIHGGLIATSKKGTPLYNLQRCGNKVVFYRKIDGKAIRMDVSLFDRPYHRLPGHERLSCQACHSKWMPQCYGCHLSYRRSYNQRDWISKKESPGRWKETRSFLRFSKPALGLKDRSSIYPISPCQVFVSVFGDKDRYQAKRSFKILTMSAFDPHTTSKGSRGCIECHGDPKVLGLGEGILNHTRGKMVFRPTCDSKSSFLSIPFALDSYVDLSGKALQASSRKESRPFNHHEIKEILSVNVCLGCHTRYEDRIYKDFDKSKRRFQTEPGLPCLK